MTDILLTVGIYFLGGCGFFLLAKTIAEFHKFIDNEERT